MEKKILLVFYTFSMNTFFNGKKKKTPNNFFLTLLLRRYLSIVSNSFYMVERIIKIHRGESANEKNRRYSIGVVRMKNAVEIIAFIKAGEQWEFTIFILFRCLHFYFRFLVTFKVSKYTLWFLFERILIPYWWGYSIPSMKLNVDKYVCSNY